MLFLLIMRSLTIIAALAIGTITFAQSTPTRVGKQAPAGVKDLDSARRLAEKAQARLGMDNARKDQGGGWAKGGGGWSTNSGRSGSSR